MTRSRSLPIALVLAVVATLVFIGWRAFAGSDQTEFVARFEATIGLYPGSDVQVLGVPVGEVLSVKPDGAKVLVRMRLDSGQKVDDETRAVIVAPTLVSDRFVQLTEPYDGGRALPDGAVIPESRTAVPVEIDELYRSLEEVSATFGPDGANKNGALSRLLTVAAENLGGNGRDLNEMISEFGKASATLAGTGDDLFGTIENLHEFNTMLVANDAEVATANKRFADVAAYLSADRKDLAQAVANLADALGVVDDFIKENRAHLSRSLKNLHGPTQVLARQKKSLNEAARLIPLALQNFLKAYDARTNTVHGRGNLNEISIWANGLGARTSAGAPPNLLPSMGGR
ncbi:MCE family protein [Nocardioides marmoriginsengisoli]|uniref:MCE family protein n=1 Tax=Nocardioides marmoriginsengisoli TaxID=661483 RepID=A0A3N0CN22_9ACTN|nr:MCE family protein [Nocardioides marmoriginsengisoli]RNL64835.1 MCE family protein [Nocardioides marmoriginsengisoli]